MRQTLQGKMNVSDIFWSTGESFQSEVMAWIRAVDDRSLCFVAWRVNASLSRLDLLRQTFRDWKKSLLLENTFYQRDGTPLIDVYRIGEQGTRSMHRDDEPFSDLIHHSGVRLLDHAFERGDIAHVTLPRWS